MRLIKYDVIKDTAKKIEIELNELIYEEKKLENNIKLVNSLYKGKDATIIIQKFNESIKILKEYMIVVDTNNNYFKWISGCYKDNHETAKKNLITDEIISIDEEVPVLNMDNIVKEGEKNA